MKLLSSIFKVSNYIAMLGWAILAIFPESSYGYKAVVGISVFLLGISYTYLVFFGKNLDAPDLKISGNFWSLRGVMNLFKSPRAVLAGWIHYLAFDLMIGLFIVIDAQKYNLPHWMILPCLFMTLMFGPAGLLIYMLLRVSFSDSFLLMNLY